MPRPPETTPPLATGIALLCGLLAAVCVAVRFPPVAETLPAGLGDAGFSLVGFALGGTVAAEAWCVRRKVGPLWMRVAAAPRLACALGVTFITTVLAQTLKISLGPVDPTFSATAPMATNALWFFVFTLGFTGLGMMSAPSLVLPFLHPLARGLRRFPLLVAVGLLGGALAGLGEAFRRTLALPELVDAIAAARLWCAANDTLVTAALLVVTLGPLLLGGRAEPDDPDRRGL